MRSFLTISILAAALFMSAFAQENGWRVDKAHSSISFSISHMVISEVHGRFDDFDITFASSKDDFSDAAVAATIRVNSVSTGAEGRDKDLRSENFFDAQKFPEIKFVSTSFTKVGDNKYDIAGNLTIRDVTKPVVFHGEYRGTLKTQRGLLSAWKASLEINRFDYGLKWNRMVETGGLVAGETVTIAVNLELRKPG